MDYNKEQQSLALIEELEDYINEARSAFMNNSKISVDREEIMALIAGIKEAIPMDMTQARWLLEEREKMDQQAKDTAEAILEEARQKADEMIENDEITRFAKSRAKYIEDTATENARDINNKNIMFISSKVNQMEEDLNDKAQVVDRAAKQALDNVNKELERTLEYMNRTVRSSLDQMMQQISAFEDQTQEILSELYEEKQALEELIQHPPIRKEL